MHRIFGLLTLETLVLVLSLFLLAYVKKNELGKLFQYIAASVSIFIAVLMIGSVFTCCIPCYRMGGGNGSCGPMMNECRMGGPGPMGCSSGRMNCKIKGDKEDCCMMDTKADMCCEEKEIVIDIEDGGNGRDTIEKKVIIKKTK